MALEVQHGEEPVADIQGFALAYNSSKFTVLECFESGSLKNLLADVLIQYTQQITYIVCYRSLNVVSF